MRDLIEIASSVNHIINDIKAEAVAADIVENGLDPSEIVVIPDGSFTRNYSMDVSYAEVIKSANGQKSLGLHITRDGLYDSLPESVFHDQSHESLTSGHDMAKLSKKQKMEEKEARLFFLPFENEIFTHRVQIELEERKILYQFSENLFNDVYPQFWNLDRSLPKKLVSRFVLILHLANKIVGRLDLTEKCLEVILDEHVKINVTTRKQWEKTLPATSVLNTPGLGSCTLGDDLICGAYVSDTDPVMEFVIGPLKNTAITDYLENGDCSRFLSCFYSYFVPMEMDAVTTVNVSNTQQQFILGDHTSNAILGFNAGI